MLFSTENIVLLKSRKRHLIQFSMKSGKNPSMKMNLPNLV